jgi:RNA polymerase sigma factor (sigma-70 family)
VRGAKGALIPEILFFLAADAGESSLSFVAEKDFEELVDTLYEPLYRFAFTLSRNEADAADLTQQAFYLWAAKGHQLRDRTKVKTWLFTTLYREFLATRRKQERFTPCEEDVEADSTPVPASVINRLDGQAAQKALLSLPETYRSPLTLFYLQEQSYREIAEILGIPVGTVMSRISRAKAALRKLLDESNKPTESGERLAP